MTDRTEELAALSRKIDEAIYKYLGPAQWQSWNIATEAAQAVGVAGWVGPEEHRADSDHTSCVEAYSALLERVEELRRIVASATKPTEPEETP